MRVLPRPQSLAKALRRLLFLAGAGLLCLWQLESDWPLARAALRRIHPALQVLALTTFVLGCVWAALLVLLIEPLKRECRRMNATVRPASQGQHNALWDRDLDG